MIELITNGALPRPAKCLSCGYSGPDRYYFRFQAFIPRLGQVLLCTAKPESDDQTGCMNEAARRFELGFVERVEINRLLSENTTLRNQNERLAVATNKFTDSFADLVSGFLSDIVEPNPVAQTGSDSESIDRTSGQAISALSK